ncbi:OmpA family protein [Vibrio paucivorans]
MYYRLAFISIFISFSNVVYSASCETRFVTSNTYYQGNLSNVSETITEDNSNCFADDEENQSSTMNYSKFTEMMAKHRSASILFSFDSYLLSEQSKNRLVAKIQDVSSKIIVIGFTDYIGSSNYNDSLGMKRAESIREYLVSIGITRDKIEVYTAGEKYSISDDLSLNRRGVILW